VMMMNLIEGEIKLRSYLSNKTNDSGSMHPDFILYEELKISTCPCIVSSQQSLCYISYSSAMREIPFFTT